jgi:TonB family protein
MNLKPVLSFGVVYFLSIPFLYGQSLKKVSKNPYPDFNEQYYVLKDNTGIKEGQYKLIIHGVVYQCGTYKNNQKSGEW